MLRRRHKKSKAGCSECKKRHIKCDENRPICVNCSTGTMKCSFASPIKLVRVPKENKPVAITPLHNTPRSNTPTTSTSSIQSAFAQAEPYVNATHVELFYWFIESGEWAFQDDNHRAIRPHVLRYVLTYPFLLDELLAVSALHLSTSRLDKKLFYRDEATRLQSHALRLFNESIQDLNFQNIIPTFIFSALQGIATFFETFHDPTYETSDWKFFEKIVQSVRLLQGVRSIIDGWWDFLTASDIQDMFKDPIPDPEWSDNNMARFEAFRVQILESSELDHIEKAVCDKAIEELISVYRAAFSLGDRSECSIHNQGAARYATKWLIIVPLAYTELLVQRKSEALVILGYFAVMLHKLKACWTVGDAGKQLLLAVEAHLEESWHPILLWPKSFVEGN